MTERKLTSLEAYKAMHAFLDFHYELTGSDEIGSLLGSMSLLEDENPADSAMASEWDRAIKKVIFKNYDAKLKIRE